MDILKKPSPNYEDRHGWKPDIIVYHITEGSAESAVNWFQSTASGVSTHFIVSKKGEIYQCVDITKTAYGNKTSTDPSYNSYYGKSEIKAIRDRKTSANFYTVSIEHEGIFAQTGGKLTDAQLKASIDLTVYIIKEVKRIYGIDIPVDREHLIGHYQTNKIDKVNCPGRDFPWTELVSGVKKAMGQTVSAPGTPSKVDPVDWLGKYLGTKGIEIQDRAFGKGNRDDYCAAGTSIALMESGVKLPKIYTWVDDLRAWFMRQGLYRTRESGYKPNKKDTIFFDWYLTETGGRNGVGNHVGLVKSSDSTYVYTREPNAGNAGLVADRSFKLTDPDIMGYGVYPEATEDDKQVTIPATKGYSSVDNLKAGKTPVDLKEGMYFVFKEYEGYLNVSKTPGIPGAWIELKKEEIKLEKPMGITTSEEVKGYTSVDDLKAGKNPVVIMPGSYTIHKTYGEYVNITKPQNPGTPGAWIKLKGVK